MIQELNKSALSLEDRAMLIAKFRAEGLILAEALHEINDIEKRVIDSAVAVKHADLKVRQAVQEKINYGITLSEEDYEEIYRMTNQISTPKEKLYLPQQDTSNLVYVNQEALAAHTMSRLGMHMTANPGFDRHNKDYWERPQA